jgi:hypothetical protein
MQQEERRMKPLRSIRVALVGLWLGGMASFSWIVAPVAFTVLPNPALAGNIVSRHLVITEWIGIVLGTILLALLWLEARKESGRQGGRVEAGLLLSMVGAMAVSRAWVSRTLHQIRLEFGERLQTLPPDDPTRQTFDLLHQVSVGLMGWTMLAAVLLLVWLIRNPSLRSRP